MILKIDEVDFYFICRVLSKAKAEFKNRMMDTSISEGYRNHFRESAKMANAAWEMMFAAKREAENDEQHGDVIAPAEGGAKCVNGLRGEPDCRGCNERCEDVRKRNCFYWNPDIEGGVCALTGKKSCPISCDNFHVPEKGSPPPAEGGAE